VATVRGRFSGVVDFMQVAVPAGRKRAFVLLVLFMPLFFDAAPSLLFFALFFF
jgi:hypothetical protein